MCDSFCRLQRLTTVAMLADKGLNGFQVIRQHGATLVSLKQIRKMCREFEGSLPFAFPSSASSLRGCRVVRL